MQSILRTAKFSECRTRRYSLTRRWDASQPLLAVIGLNPSTADATQDDPTIRRCIDFAKRWNCGGLVMLNLFAVRSTDPKRLRTFADPIGPANDATICELTKKSVIVLAAWGAFPLAAARASAVLPLIGREVMCLRKTKKGALAHPLYIPAVTMPVCYWQPRG